MSLARLAIAVGLVAEMVKLGVPWRAELRRLFERVGAGKNVDPDVLHAVAWQESGVDPDTKRGTSGEIGLMQVIPGNVRDRPVGIVFTEKELSSVEGNVLAAARLWKAHEALIGPSVADGFSAYNAGLAGQRAVKRSAAGGYVNERYVFDAFAKYAALKVASVAPSNLIRRV